VKEFLEYFEVLGSSTRGKNRPVSAINKRYAGEKATSIKDLFSILEDPAKHQHRRFIIEGYILEFSSYKFKEIIKKVGGSGRVYAFEEKPNEEIVKYIYHFMAYMKDSSNEDEKRNLNVYILTNEEDQRLFDAWRMLPSPAELELWEKISKTDIEKFEKKFQELTNPENQVKMVVELLITGSGKAFFKLFDTIFV